MIQGSAGPGFVNRDWDWEIPPFGPANEIGTGNSLSWVLLSGRDREWILISPAYETGMGPYLVPGLSKVPGTFQWSHKRDQEWDFYCSGPVNGNETGNLIYAVPLMRTGRDHTYSQEWDRDGSPAEPCL